MIPATSHPMDISRYRECSGVRSPHLYNVYASRRITTSGHTDHSFKKSVQYHPVPWHRNAWHDTALHRLQTHPLCLSTAPLGSMPCGDMPSTMENPKLETMPFTASSRPGCGPLNSHHHVPRYRKKGHSSKQNSQELLANYRN